MTATGYTFDENGTMTSAPCLWGVPTMPSGYAWKRWKDHVRVCAQCAQHAHEKAAPAGAFTTLPCEAGEEMISDYLCTVRMQAADARWN